MVHHVNGDDLHVLSDIGKHFLGEKYVAKLKAQIVYLSNMVQIDN